MASRVFSLLKEKNKSAAADTRYKRWGDHNSTEKVTGHWGSNASPLPPVSLSIAGISVACIKNVHLHR